MYRGNAVRIPPGASVLGGAACGLSYEGVMRDAMARDETARRREAGRNRGTPAPQQQRVQGMPAGQAPQARQAGQ
ncbi:hypothetical protein GCM10011504_16040 [Siccirubricoccus deserti]|uniref:Uncharacterized protein n=1 Tax=Siccirubricoccus deserti TaxID=2013562 RepID=A0A9X0QYD6_9PROT|nr:hypothetical protein [Siccirubricoccus deserti]MBC4015168.1 hypothetical protein [Siccirubricoccus deserti]GGC38438.1 hypothetical protein GCM10011504_16040 [Siccirubricoccus deserti]